MCARLTVPMDYNRPLNASEVYPRVHIALIMLPGLNHISTQNYSVSPLLLNPGGPGGSGVKMLKSWGTRIRSIVGDDQDVIGFDPRGIGESTPRVDCFFFPSARNPAEDDIVKSSFHRMVWSTSGSHAGIINLRSDDALMNLDNRARALAKLCKAKEKLKGEDSILRHVGTPNVARDMLSIIDAWDTRTDKIDALYDITGPKKEGNGVSTLNRQGKLTFWGFGYGSLLGTTFATMFPSRIGRVVLDGVFDANDYTDYSQESMIRDIGDIDNVLSSFFYYCHLAEQSCQFYRSHDTFSGIKARFNDIMNDLEQRAITFVDPISKLPGIITYGYFKVLLFGAMHDPIKTFPVIAQLLDSFDRGDEELIAQVFTRRSLDYKPYHQPVHPGSAYVGEASTAIACSDKRYPVSITIRFFSHPFSLPKQPSCDSREN